MDISKLFKWKKEYTLVDSQGNPVVDEDDKEITVYIRVIGDNDLDEAKKFALRESRKLRNKYRASPEEILPDMDELTSTELATLVTLNEASFLYKQAERETTLPYPNSTNSLHIEDEEIYLEKLDSYFEDLIIAVDERAQKLFIETKAKYESMPIDRLRTRARNTYIDKIVEAEIVKFYNDAILFYAIYEDEACEKRVFSDIDDVRNTSRLLKEQLYTEYSKLVLTDLELKK